MGQMEEVTRLGWQRHTYRRTHTIRDKGIDFTSTRGQNWRRINSLGNDLCDRCKVKPFHRGIYIFTDPDAIIIKYTQVILSKDMSLF